MIPSVLLTIVTLQVLLTGLEQVNGRKCYCTDEICKVKGETHCETPFSCAAKVRKATKFNISEEGQIETKVNWLEYTCQRPVNGRKNIQCTSVTRGAKGSEYQHLACCEDGDFCNKKFRVEEDFGLMPIKITWTPHLNKSASDGQPVNLAEKNDSGTRPSSGSKSVQNVLIAMIGPVAACLMVVLGLLVWRKRRNSWKGNCLDAGTPARKILGTSYIQDEVASIEAGVVGNDESSGRGVSQLEERTISREIELEELIGSGRYGEVYRGVWRGNQVAVKIFKTIEEASFFREVDFFNMSMIRHENILGFQAADNRDLSMETQLWMVLDYHRSGSLFDYLRRHSVQNSPGDRKLTRDDLHKLTFSISTGLMHLHNHIDGSAYGFKPSVAHRDLKSKNILVKSDGTCCIADFGMAVRADRFTTIDKTNLKVGTRRYMAPEILDDSIKSSLFESLRKVDMYALALVFWEVATVCCPAEGEQPVYRFPYEDCVPGDPSVDDMYKVVCQNGQRPALPNHWLTDPAMKVFVRIVRMCWKESPQARFAANRVWKNLQEL